ncbi:LCP family protein [Saccharothrix obliqua]|uniref:LCP family protein n=1 Tax=Saccharothrix obliqua TaxID=2861747 RepID=UPI001C5FD4A8|nr:LCP family protein [Saccharothrix obliqua]MBW4715752.1 LCP family protein [Saccharothrix obliqua]
MPDEPRRGGPGPRGDQAPHDDQPTGRRRRSLEGSGGLSVSELLEQHSRTNLPRPVPPDERRPEPPGAPQSSGRRAAPDERPPAEDPTSAGRRARPEATGRRARPDTPHAPENTGLEPTGRRAAPGPAESTGRRARPDDAPGRRAAPVDPPGHGEPTGRRAVNDAGRRAAPGPAESTGRRARPDDHTGRRPHPGSPEDAVRRQEPGTGRRARPGVPPPPNGDVRPDMRRLGGEEAPRNGVPPRDNGFAPEDTGRRAAFPPGDVRRGPDEAEGTGRRPHPAPGRRFAEGPEATGRRPQSPDGPRRLAPDHGPDGSGPRRFPDGPPRRLAEGGPDGSGPRRLAEGVPGNHPDAPRRPVDGGPGRVPDGPDVPPRRVTEPGRRPTDGPDAGPRRLAEGPDSGPRRLADGPAPDPRRLADGPETPPRRFAEGPDVPRRLADPDTGRRPVAGGPDGSGPRRLADPEDGPRRPDAPDAPRRPVDGPRRPVDAPDGPRRPADVPDGPRRPVDGPDGPRRLAEAPDGPARRPEGGPDGSGPRRLPDAEGDQPAGGISGRLGAPRDQVDPASLTTEMEAISDDVKKRREVDHTLARFSAVHDELAEQERLRKERRQKLMPWKSDHDEDATVYTSSVEDDDEDTPRRRVRTVKHSKIVRVIKVLSLTAAVLVFVATGLGWGARIYVDSKFTEIEALTTDSKAVHEAEKQLGDENFLIVGSDTRAGAKPQDGVGDEGAEPGARSDVLMLAHIPADRKRVVVVSVPRDLVITRPECEKWDYTTGQYTGEVLPPVQGVKSNQAYADGGPKCVSKFMTELTGLDINHFISVDFNGFKDMVDAIGTIKVCVPKVMDDGELGMIFDKPGQYEIDGQKALDYVRARHVKVEELGDYDRITRQQKFLSSLLRTALSSEMLLSPVKLNAFLNAFASATVGQNIGVNDMLTLAQSMQGLEAGRVSFITVPHYTDEGPTKSNDDNLEMLKLDETKALFQAIIDGTPLPGEAPDADAPPPAGEKKPAGPKQGKVIDPKGVKIQVRNGDEGNPGAATRATNALTELGFEVVDRGDAAPAGKTIIKYGTGGEDAAATLAAAVPGATLEVDETQGGAVTLLIGPGWDEKVKGPGSGAAEPGKATPPPDLPVVNAAKDPCA